MNIGNVLLHASAEKTDHQRGAAAWALGVAEQFGAALTALVYPLDVVVPRSANDRQSADNSRVEVENGNRDAAERLRSVARQRNIEAEIIAERSFAYGIPEIVADRARLHDLVVTGIDHTGLLSERSVTEHLLFESGRPVVIVPESYEPPFSCLQVAVAWDWGRAAARALGDAIPLLRSATEVRIVSFTDEKQFDTSRWEMRCAKRRLNKAPTCW